MPRLSEQMVAIMAQFIWQDTRSNVIWSLLFVIARPNYICQHASKCMTGTSWLMQQDSCPTLSNRQQWKRFIPLWSRNGRQVCDTGLVIIRPVKQIGFTMKWASFTISSERLCH